MREFIAGIVLGLISAAITFVVSGVAGTAATVGIIVFLVVWLGLLLLFGDDKGDLDFNIFD